MKEFENPLLHFDVMYVFADMTEQSSMSIASSKAYNMYIRTVSTRGTKHTISLYSSQFGSHDLFQLRLRKSKHKRMSLTLDHRDKIDRLLDQDPNVTIFLKPIAAPAALGLAGFSGATWITASWIAGWWGNDTSPTIFFPFVALWGGVAQFIAALFGFPARDTLITVVHALWGSFWISIELAAWFVVLAFFTWSAAIAAIARDFILFCVLATLATGATIACCLFAFGHGVREGMKVAAYFWIVSAIFAWWRVTVYIWEEAFGREGLMPSFPIYRMPIERRRPLMAPGLGEPGVKRGMPGVL
ncbi:hypothetical protein PRK78_007305 [Emydomyces testavorans]|uniref:Uncharacterized protein n=1 Tax=Emydomyces testavorans TaxID=2070801 RepID=A0AAF0DN02_9EURO|nr:hypothetical protein PRK78_007305 [Emydomyces testavorans]